MELIIESAVVVSANSTITSVDVRRTQAYCFVSSPSDDDDNNSFKVEFSISCSFIQHTESTWSSFLISWYHCLAFSRFAFTRNRNERLVSNNFQFTFKFLTAFIVVLYQSNLRPLCRENESWRQKTSETRGLAISFRKIFSFLCNDWHHERKSIDS